MVKKQTEAAAYLREQAPMMAEPDYGRGLYRKYDVSRVGDESGKHDDCDYFVLDLVHDPHAKAALLAYADSCDVYFPLLASDLRDRAESMRFDNE